nr:hypothetical protein [uncultured Actinoplanes sp.]
MNRISRTAAVATAVLGLTLVASGPATAAPSDRGVDVVQKALTTRIDKRLAALKKFDGTLAEAKQVQSAHRSTLDALIGTQTAGLTALRAKVQKDTTREALKADAKAMVAGYRVFILTGPKVRLTAAIDTELAVAGKLRDRKNVDAAKLDAVDKALAGKVDALLAIKPGPDGDAIRASVKQIRQSAKDARTTLKSLRKTK